MLPYQGLKLAFLSWKIGNYYIFHMKCDETIQDSTVIGWVVFVNVSMQTCSMATDINEQRMSCAGPADRQTNKLRLPSTQPCHLHG